jgi:hypothetical protein
MFNHLGSKRATLNFRKKTIKRKLQVGLMSILQRIEESLID